MARSNRKLTQFAVEKLWEYVQNGRLNFQDDKKGNTSIRFEPRGMSVYLFDSPIFTINETCITLLNGDFFDSHGRPSTTTRERLNGLLDALGDLQVIPQGVRVFIKDEQCFVGKGDHFLPLDSQNEPVLIQPNPEELYIF